MGAGWLKMTQNLERSSDLRGKKVKIDIGAEDGRSYLRAPGPKVRTQ
jgi:hypothetical protein